MEQPLRSVTPLGQVIVAALQRTLQNVPQDAPQLLPALQEESPRETLSASGLSEKHVPVDAPTEVRTLHPTSMRRCGLLMQEGRIAKLLPPVADEQSAPAVSNAPPHASMAGATSLDSVACPPASNGEWVAAAIKDECGIVCYVLDARELRTRVRFVLEGSTRISLRLLPHHLSLADDQGRLLALDLESGVLTRDLRI
jgi:hypothetical protein